MRPPLERCRLLRRRLLRIGPSQHRAPRAEPERENASIHESGSDKALPRLTAEELQRSAFAEVKFYVQHIPTPIIRAPNHLQVIVH